MIQLSTLGYLHLSDTDGREVGSLLAQPRRFGLLVYLALAPAGRYRRRDTLLSLLWPELDEEHARGALRQALRFLRRARGDGVVVTRGDEEIGIDPAALTADVTALIAACEAGTPDRAMALYQGDFLDGFFAADAAPEFQQWIDGERTDLRRRAANAAWTLAGRHADAADGARAEEWARRAVALGPDDEPSIRRLLTLLDRFGDRAAALAAYDEFASGVRAEYDSEPAPETQAVVRSIRDRAGCWRSPR